MMLWLPAVSPALVKVALPALRVLLPKMALQVQVSPRWLPFQPPNRTRPPVAAPSAMLAQSRAGGLLAGAAWAQVLPFQVQVSPSTPATALPPNRTTLPVAAS